MENGGKDTQNNCLFVATAKKLASVQDEVSQNEQHRNGKGKS